MNSTPSCSISYIQLFLYFRLTLTSILPIQVIQFAWDHRVTLSYCCHGGVLQKNTVFFSTVPLVPSNFFVPKMCPGHSCPVIQPNGRHPDFHQTDKAARHLIPEQLCTQLGCAMAEYANAHTSNAYWKTGRPFKACPIDKGNYFAPTGMARKGV